VAVAREHSFFGKVELIAISSFRQLARASASRWESDPTKPGSRPLDRRTVPSELLSGAGHRAITVARRSRRGRTVVMGFANCSVRAVPVYGHPKRAPLLCRILLLVAFPLGLAAVPAAAAPDAPDAKATAFMSELWNQALELLNKKAPPAEREARFRELFHKDFDTPGIARFVLGRYWRTASPQEQKEFLKLFDDYVVYVYTARWSDFEGEQFKITGTHPDQDSVLVSTDVSTPGAPQAFKVDWRLKSNDGAYKISDVIVDGVSMLVTQRSEFASVIQRHGGQVQGLLDLMREKTASAAQ
jgi:phospholipid transport system substrate-binding protein